MDIQNDSTQNVMNIQKCFHSECDENPKNDYRQNVISIQKCLYSEYNDHSKTTTSNKTNSHFDMN